MGNEALEQEVKAVALEGAPDTADKGAARPEEASGAIEQMSDGARQSMFQAAKPPCENPRTCTRFVSTANSSITRCSIAISLSWCSNGCQ